METTDNIIVWFINKFIHHRISVHAAQVAFFIMVSFFPFSMFLITLLGYTSIEEHVLQTIVQDIIPGSLSALVSGWIQESYHASGTILSITVISTLWAGSKGIDSLSFEFENIYELENRRNFVMRRIHSILDTVLFTAMIIISLIVLVYGNQIVQLITHYFPSIEHLEILLFITRAGLALFLFSFYFTCMYCFIPKRHGKIRDEIPGAIFSAFLWILFSYLYSIYVDSKPVLGSVYGSLTSLVLLMLWLYFCIVILFSGALLNNYLRHHTKLNLLAALKELPSLLPSFRENRK